MRRSLCLLLLALPSAACLDSATSGVVDPDAAFRGTFLIEVSPLNLGGLGSVIVDFGAGPETSDAGWERARVLWLPSERATATVVLPCDTRRNPHRVEAHVTGVYADVVDDIGGFGDAVPEGLPFQDPGYFTRTAICVAGQQVRVGFDIQLMKPAEQGFFEIVARLDAGDDVRDAVWAVDVANGDAPPQQVWRYNLTSSTFGDSHGGAAYVGPCDAADGDADNVATVALIGLFDARQDQREPYDAPVVPVSDPLEHWVPPAITRAATCSVNADTTLVNELTVARVDRSDGAVRARFAGLRCEAAWTCPAAGVSDLPALVWSCEAPETAPTLLVDDLDVVCDGQLLAALGAWDDAELAVETPPEGPARTTWRRWLPPDAAPAGAPCVLEARATAYPGSTMPSLGGGSWILPIHRVYPEARWTIPLSAAGCVPASLATDGPITIGYTATDEAEGPAYHHTLAPDGR